MTQSALVILACFLCTACLIGLIAPTTWSILPALSIWLWFLGHQNVPMFHMVTIQFPPQRIHWTFARKPVIKCVRYSLFTYPDRNFLPCMPLSHPASFTKNKALQYDYVLTGKVSSLSDFHFKCEKYDEKWRLLVWFCFALQLKSVKMLGFCPCWMLTQKIEFNQQLSTLVLPCEVQSTSPFPLMTHEWNRCSLV